MTNSKREKNTFAGGLRRDPAFVCQEVEALWPVRPNQIRKFFERQKRKPG